MRALGFREALRRFPNCRAASHKEIRMTKIIVYQVEFYDIQNDTMILRKITADRRQFNTQDDGTRFQGSN